MLLLGVLTIAGLLWTLQTAFTLIAILLGIAFERGRLPHPMEVGLQFVVAAGISVVAYLLFRQQVAGGHRRTNKLGFETPSPHKGLVLPLPPYLKLDSDYELQELLELLQAEGYTHEIRSQIYRSNWASLAVAVEHHAPALQQCWLVASEGGMSLYWEKAARLIRIIAGEQIGIHKVEVPNIEDALMIASAVKEQIYDRVEAEFSLPMKSIIADLSPAYAAMSTGLLLACFQAGVPFQYLRPNLRLLNPSTGIPLTLEEIKQKKILVGIPGI